MQTCSLRLVAGQQWSGGPQPAGHLTGPDEFGSNSRHRPDIGNLRRITTDSEQWMLRSLASTADWVGRKGQQNSAGLPTLGQVNQLSFAAWS